jgi:hypothetical protein
MNEERQLIYRVLLELGKSPQEAERLSAEIDKITNSANQAKKATEDFSKAAKANAKLQEDQARSSGLAGAAAFELGRTISDLPFGLVAISNNISQLGTIMAALVANAGSLRRALVLLKAQLLGPAGLLIAFQSIVAAITFYSQKTARANKETDKFNTRLSELNTEVLKLEALAEIAQDGTASLETQKNALDALKKQGFDPATQSINEFIAAQQKLAISRATAEMFAEDIAASEKERLDLLRDSRELLTDYLEATQEGDTFRASIISSQLEKVRENVKTIEGEISDSQGRLKELFRDGDLVDFLFGGTDQEGEPEGKTRDKVKKLVATYFGTTYQELEKRKKEAEEIRKALGLEPIEDTLRASGEKAAADFMEEFGDGVSTGIKETLEDTTISLEEGLELAQQALNSTFDLLSSQIEKEIALEETKTIAINDQLRERLRNEQLSADERDRINQEIARNDAALIEKQNELEKKRFRLNKAAAISNAIVNTALAVSNALKDLPVPANFIAAGVVGAAGAAQIAAISNQQFVPQASPNPRLTGLGTTEPTAPAFNVVGSSQRNQLAEAVSSALSDKPVKAYVVSSDVSTAQELDRRIVEGASI